MQQTKQLIARASMLIRRPVSEVFEAFVNPAITTKFWFTKSTGTLEQGKQLTWTWEMYGVSTQVLVKELKQNEKICIAWGDPNMMTQVEWVFTTKENESTYVTITNTGFTGDPDSTVAQALDAVGGFTTVLDGAKAWLEHKMRLNLIQDKFPDKLTQ